MQVDMKVCFIGHKTIEITDTLINSLKETILTLITNGVNAFLFGSNSNFNNLAWEIVSEFKRTYPYVKRIYVRSEYQFIDKSYEEYLLKSYEETYFPPKLKRAGKFSYVERNYDMIDNSVYCIFYYDENYVPPLKRQSKNNMLPPIRRKSGTKIAYEYAIKKNKKIINLHK